MRQTSQHIKIIECPRDAMQGIKAFIPTEIKAQYIQALLGVGFDTIDFGSFVSSKAIPQLQDTAAVLERLDLSKTSSKLLAIVANRRGAVAACMHETIAYLGYPFSISENFQMRNTHKTIAQSIEVLSDILMFSDRANKKVVVYLSMGFGNPYGDPWSTELVCRWVEKLNDIGVRIISLSDTVGVATPARIAFLFETLIRAYPHMEFGAHLHSTPHTWHAKVHAAYEAGCRRFDGAIQGLGGCPMAKDERIGNMPTEKLFSYFTVAGQNTLDAMRFESAYNEAYKVFNTYY